MNTSYEFVKAYKMKAEKMKAILIIEFKHFSFEFELWADNDQSTFF